jgi:hypothetical protein
MVRPVLDEERSPLLANGDTQYQSTNQQNGRVVTATPASEISKGKFAWIMAGLFGPSKWH